MANKHEIQRDFYKKKKEWKEQLKLKNKEEVLFDEEIYPEFKNEKETRTYYREYKER